jgi:hypothetical protein
MSPEEMAKIINRKQTINQMETPKETLTGIRAIEKKISKRSDGPRKINVQETLNAEETVGGYYSIQSRRKRNESIKKSLGKFGESIQGALFTVVNALTGTAQVSADATRTIVSTMAQGGRWIWDTLPESTKIDYIRAANIIFGTADIPMAIGLANTHAGVTLYEQDRVNPQQALLALPGYDPGNVAISMADFLTKAFIPNMKQVAQIIASTSADSIRAIQGSVESVAAATHSIATSVVETAHQSLSSIGTVYGKSLNATQSAADYGYSSFPFAMTDTAIQQAMEDKYNAGERSMVDKFAENLVSWTQGPHLRGTASDRMANISVGQGSSITKPFVYTPMQSWYGTMATGPLGPSVFSYNGHDVNFNTDVFYASQGTQSMLLPLGDVGYDFSRYAAGLTKPTSYKTPDNRRDLRPTDISSKKNIFPGADRVGMVPAFRNYTTRM